jgi:hypothetical protein
MQVSGGKQERKRKQELAKQERGSIEDKNQAIDSRLLPASNTKHTQLPHSTRSAAQSSKASGEQYCSRRSNLTPYPLQKGELATILNVRII